jgi:hypothetical protein
MIRATSKMQRVLVRGGLVLGLLGGMSLTGGFASAALPVGTGAAGPTLQDLINLNGTGGFTIGDKQFFNFSYLGSASNPANPSPTPTQIFITTAPGSNIGLTFESADWFSADGGNVDSLIRYAVRVTDPTQRISVVNLSFNGDAVTPGTSTTAAITENVSPIDSLGNPDLTQPAQQVSVIDYGDSNPDNRLVSPLTLSSPLSGIYVTKDIQLHSAPRLLGGGTATISAVNNSYQQTTVPEPAAIGLFGLAGAALLRRRRA